DGFIETVPGKGSFIANKNTDFMREEALRQIEAALTHGVDIARRSGVSSAEITEMLAIILEE
ncbi:MAG: GntR family transcriptional regulator, partial [Ruthenibacterium sp.]